MIKEGSEKVNKMKIHRIQKGILFVILYRYVQDFLISHKEYWNQVLMPVRVEMVMSSLLGSCLEGVCLGRFNLETVEAILDLNCCLSQCST